MSNREEAQKFFGQHAAAYTLSGHPNIGDLERMLALMAPTGLEVALDVATAAGNTAILLAPLVARVVGLDITVEMGQEFAAQVQQTGVRNAWFTVGEVERLPFPDGCFDLVTCRRAAHHFAHPALALAEMARVLRPEGRLGVADMMAPEGTAADLFNAMERTRDRSHVRALGAEEWRLAAEDVGLEVQALEPSLEERELSNWLFPVPAGGPEAAEALALAEAAVPEVASKVVKRVQGGVLFLKGRIVLVAVKR